MTYKAKPGASKILKAVRMCAHEGCRRYTMFQLCAEHRPQEPQGEWKISQEINAELAGRDKRQSKNKGVERHDTYPEDGQEP